MNKKISLLLFITIYSLGNTCQIKAMDPINKENKKLATELLLKELSKRKPDLDYISNLIQQGANVNAENNLDISPLQVAAAYNNSQLAELLITNGAFVDVPDNKGNTPLEFACIKGSMDVIKLLCEKGANVNRKNNEGNSPLHGACLSEHFNVANYLIDKGALVDITNNQLLTPLDIACLKGSMDVIKLLCEKGANVNRKGNEGNSPLHIACLSGHLNVVNYLIDKGALVDITNNRLLTPLDIACAKGSMDVIKLLCEKGANVNRKGNEGNSPLHIACLSGHLNVVNYLIDKGASIDITNNQLQTPLDIACANGFFKIVEFLIKNKANVTTKGYKGTTPLHWACIAKNPGPIIDLLIKKGADVNAVTPRTTWTPLHIAALQNNLPACRSLLKNGANTFMVTSDGMTALDMAYDLEYKNIITLLEPYGRQTNAQADAHMRAFFEELNQEVISKTKKKKKKKKKAHIQQQEQPMIEIGPETNSTNFPELPSEIRTNEPITNPFLEEQPIEPIVSTIETVIETSPTVSVVTQPTAPTPIQEKSIKIIPQKPINTHIAPASTPGNNGYRILIGQNLKWPHLNKNQELLIKNNLLSLKNWPKHNLGIKPLKGEVNTYRLRVGSYRIIFSVDTTRREIKIRKIGLRKEIYKQHKR